MASLWQEGWEWWGNGGWRELGVVGGSEGGGAREEGENCEHKSLLSLSSSMTQGIWVFVRLDVYY